MKYTSFKAANTGSYINTLGDGKPTQYLAMVDVKNEVVFYEDSYRGFGDFGHENYYIRYAKMNGFYYEGISIDEAIGVYFEDDGKAIYPVILELADESDAGNFTKLMNEAKKYYRVKRG